MVSPCAKLCIRHVAHVCACVCMFAHVHVRVCVRMSVISRLNILFKIYAKPTKYFLPLHMICVIIFFMWDYLSVYFMQVA